MSLHSRHHMHHFLKNKEMNEFYATYGIFNFSLELISLFVPIYFYKLGYSLPWILFYYFLISLSFVIFSFTGARIVSKFGIKYSMLTTVPILIVYFIGLRFVPHLPLLFFILPFLASFKMILFNYSFHLNFLQHSDKKNRGKEEAALQASALFASFLAPFLGGIIIKLAGFPVLFTTGSLVLFFAFIPLFMSKEKFEPISFEKKNLIKDLFKKENLPCSLSFAGYAIESWIGAIIWPLFLFLILFNTESVGVVMSLTTILTFLIFYIIGKETDKRDKKRLLRAGTILYFIGWIGRLFVNSFVSILFIDTYANLTQKVLQVPWSAYSYDIAAKRNYFKFIVQREITFNLTRIMALPLLMLIFLLNWHTFAISFALAAFASLLYVTLNDTETV
jgi:MFS family permease